MRVAAGVVGPFAASTTISALISWALSSVIWFAMAAGTKISQSISNNSLFEIVSSNKFVTVPKLSLLSNR